MSGSLIITAAGVDFKFVNRLLLYLRDWEYGEEGSNDNFTLCLSKKKHIEIDKDLPPTVPPVKSIARNEFENMPLNTLESYMLGLKDDSAHNHLFLVLDDKGVRDQTIIIMERAIDDESEECDYLDEYNKARVPWDEAYLMWCNLSISNMGFEDFCDDDKGKSEDDWWTYDSPGGGEEEGNAEQREPVIQKLKRQGLA